MTPAENMRLRLLSTTGEWRAAVQREDRDEEAACMARINDLLDQYRVFAEGESWGSCSTL